MWASSGEHLHIPNPGQHNLNINLPTGRYPQRTDSRIGHDNNEEKRATKKTRQTACCFVMQCTLPPPTRITRPSAIGTTSRVGNCARRHSTAAASRSSSPNIGTITPPPPPLLPARQTAVENDTDQKKEYHHNRDGDLRNPPAHVKQTSKAK